MRRSQRSLSGRVVAITGGARGIGKATAMALAAEGARVAIGDLEGELAAETANEVAGHVVGLPLDVTDNSGFRSFLDKAEGTLGPLDVLINNAGIMPTGPIDAESEGVIERTVAINLLAVMLGTREAVRRMKPRGAGHIVNVASAAGKVASAPLATYTGTKFGVYGFTQSVALELHGTGIDVSVVLPSLAKTELATGLKEPRGFGMVEPDDVAARIAGALRRPTFEVPVPAAIGPLMALNQLLPHRALARLARLTKTDQIMAGSDPSARAVYEQRLERMTSQNHGPRKS